MNLLEEIREGFASISTGKALEIQSLKNKAPAWIIRENKFYGVAVEYPKSEPVFEKFANVKLWTEKWIIDGNEKNLLLLTSEKNELMYEFASICAEFCEPGEANLRRNSLTSDPVDWWKKWRALLGNAQTEKNVYAVLGEMIILSELMKRDSTSKWTALDRASHDLVSGNSSYEVKSTIKKYESIVTINSQFQLNKTNENFSIVFCRFEPAQQGYSIDSIVETLVKLGYPREDLEAGLESFGLNYGSSIRKVKYTVLDIVEYPVDEQFPKITKYSFKNDEFPYGIESYTYDVNLSIVQNKKPFKLT